MTDEVDFAAEGLLDGLEDGPARDGRLALLRHLHAGGVPLALLHDAVAGERLALLPVERLLGGEPRFTAREVAAEAGIDPEFLVDALEAFGIPLLDPDERRLGDSDLAAARRLRAALDSGLPTDRLVDVNRVIGRAVAPVAAAMRLLVGETYLHAGDTEDVVAARYEAAAEALLPTLAPTLEHAFALHLRELLRTDAIGETALRTGALGGGGPLAVAFADLVGFTWLGGRVPAQELGRVARRLDELARAAIRPPVRLVKQIGDAVMLSSPDPIALVETTLALVAAADEEAQREGFPRLRAGVSLGEALERDGDVYGQAVNLASRLTAIARPGSVLTDEHVRDAARDAFAWSYAGARPIKGLSDEPRLFRPRPLASSDLDAATL